jgi:uracil-DNA glycosylase family 4
MKDFSNYIKYFTEAGVDAFLENEPSNASVEAKILENGPEKKSSNIVADSKTLADSAKDLMQLREIVQNFNGCDLKKTAKNTVFADGSASAEIMFIGEAPGANEDEKGIPFCGQSGKLLDNIVRSIGLSRSDVYITNTVFWRPPANRRPTAAEIKICRPFVEKHISLVKPKLIVLVGSTAVESLLTAEINMHQLRSEFYNYTNEYLDSPIKTAVIFHPSYLLRQQYKKKLMWTDMLKLSQFLQNHSS